MLGVPKQDFHGTHAPSVPLGRIVKCSTVSIAFPVTIPQCNPPRVAPITKDATLLSPPFNPMRAFFSGLRQTAHAVDVPQWSTVRFLLLLRSPRFMKPQLPGYEPMLAAYHRAPLLWNCAT